MSAEAEIIKSFRLPKVLNDRFKKKYPSRGSQSNVLRGLIQMHLNGQVQTVKYIKEFSSENPKK